MLIQYGNRTFIVKWRYIEGGRKNGRRTFCQVLEKRGSDRLEIGVGEARCNTVDHFDKNTGRKLSLQRALTTGHIFVDGNGFLAPAPKDRLLSKEERSAIWSEYFNMVGGII
jgi:hypothetical protein